MGKQRRDPQEQPFTWLAATQLICRVKHADGRQLALMVSSFDGDNHVAAVELPKGVKTGAAALEHHAHKLIGKYDSPITAAVHAEGYARLWLGSDVAAPECPCEEIGVESTPPGQCWFAALDRSGTLRYCDRGTHDGDDHRSQGVPPGAKWVPWDVDAA